MGKTRNFRVLLRNAFARVNHNKAYVRSLDCKLGTHDRKSLDAVIDLGFTANSRCVNKNIFAEFVIHAAVDSVARCACDVGNNAAILTENEVDERGFSDIRLADNGNLDSIIVFLVLLKFRQSRNAGIKHVARSVTVNG